MAVERTLSIVKPDGVARNLIGDVYRRFESAGLRIVAARMLRLTQQQAELFYAVHRERPFYRDLVRYMSSGPVIAQILEGEGAIARNRDIMGATDPKKAAPGTIRADLAESIEAECRARLGCAGDRGQRDRVFLQRDGDLPAQLKRCGRTINDHRRGRDHRTALPSVSICWVCRVPSWKRSAPAWVRKPFRARQLMNWLYKRGCNRFEDMSDLARDFRAQLAARAELTLPEIVTEQQAGDGTRKWLLRADAAQAFEMVYIPESDRGTLCISSQVGCALDCAFCATAQQGFNRNLTTAEIVGQVWLANRELGFQPGGDRIITNVVLMGMGEPLANFRNVVPALRIFLDDLGFDLSRRRVTLSTSGLVPQIYRLAQEINVALAVSLHAPDDELRSRLVPINRVHPIAELLEACWHYIDEQNGRSVTFEYVMLDGVNDSPAQARALARLLAGHPAKVNLIPFNPYAGTPFRRSSEAAIGQFRDQLLRGGVMATVRRTRGDDIDAACGQLVGRVTDRTVVRLGSRVEAARPRAPRGNPASPGWGVRGPGLRRLARAPAAAPAAVTAASTAVAAA